MPIPSPGLRLLLSAGTRPSNSGNALASVLCQRRAQGVVIAEGLATMPHYTVERMMQHL